jgi:MFS family permease
LVYLHQLLNKLYIYNQGPSFSFFPSSFSHLLRSIALIGAFGNLGNSSGLLSGFIIESFGSNLGLFLSAICVWFGLFSVWLVVTNLIPSSLPLLCFSIYLAQFGGSLTSQTTACTSLSIFPSLFQYKIASLAKGYSALSGALISALSGAFFNSSPNLFILFSAVFIPICIFTGTFIVPDIPIEGSAHFDETNETISARLTPFYFHFLLLLLLSFFTAIFPLFSLFFSSLTPLFPLLAQLCGVLVVVWLGMIFIAPHSLYLCQRWWEQRSRRSSRQSGWNWRSDKSTNPYSVISDSTHTSSSVGAVTHSVDDPSVELHQLEENPLVTNESATETTTTTSDPSLEAVSSETPVKYPNYNVCLPLFPAPSPSLLSLLLLPSRSFK